MRNAKEWNPMIGNRSSRPNGDLTACMFVASGEPMHKPVTISDMIGRKGLIILASGGANLYIEKKIQIKHFTI